MILAHDEDASKGIKQPDISPKDNSQSSSPGPKLLKICCASDPDAKTTSREAVYEAAQRYVEAGLSLLPISTETPKEPDSYRLRPVIEEATGKRTITWKIFQSMRPDADELRRWYELGGQFGLAIIAGAISGGEPGCGLEIIDLDNIEVAEPWMKLVEERMPGLVARLVRVRSPRPGMHVYYRCQEFEGSQKLARRARIENGLVKEQTLIEIKGEGGYCLAPPSPRRCHPRNMIYRLEDGSPDLTQIPVISPAERHALLEAGRVLNECGDSVQSRKVRGDQPRPKLSSREGRPGDDFNQRAAWPDILEPHDWNCVGGNGGEEYWCRPGKECGTSATINFAENDLFHVFSSNAEPFEADCSYSKFHAFTVLNHAGDFQASARALRVAGYGVVGNEQGGK